jgi:hypothetical protein
VPKLSSKDQLSQGAWRQDELIAGKQQVVNWVWLCKSQVNLIQLQGQLIGLQKGNFQFRTTRNWAKVVTKQLTIFFQISALTSSAISSPIITFYP